jgi:hypothetical protein
LRSLGLQQAGVLPGAAVPCLLAHSIPGKIQANNISLQNLAIIPVDFGQTPARFNFLYFCH